MKKRKKYITNKTKITIDEEIFKIKAEELICELFVDFVNKQYQHTYLELKQD